ncbi:hypothetical protein LPJ56_004415 [Coemansia sp. RSA 2599]|nr:hypothetical protein LPJ56_004415 [Coemansia sp. RSA 2599]
MPEEPSSDVSPQEPTLIITLTEEPPFITDTKSDDVSSTKSNNRPTKSDDSSSAIVIPTFTEDNTTTSHGRPTVTDDSSSLIFVPTLSEDNTTTSHGRPTVTDDSSSLIFVPTLSEDNTTTSHGSPTVTDDESSIIVGPTSSDNSVGVSSDFSEPSGNGTDTSSQFVTNGSSTTNDNNGNTGSVSTQRPTDSDVSSQTETGVSSPGVSSHITTSSGDFGSQTESQTHTPTQTQTAPSGSDAGPTSSPTSTVTSPTVIAPTSAVPTTTEDGNNEATVSIGSSSTISTKSIIEVPTSVDFSRLVASATSTESEATNGPAYPQVIYNPASSSCSQCLRFWVRILAPYENLFGSNNYLASQAFNALPDLVASALSINTNRVTSQMIFANANAVAEISARSLKERASEIDAPHYYMSMSIIKDSTALNPKAELQALGTALGIQVRESSSDLHTLSEWGRYIDTSYLKMTSDLQELNGVAQSSPNNPTQVDSPFKGDAASNSRKKWIGVGIGVACVVLIIAGTVYMRWARRRKLQKMMKDNFWCDEDRMT